MNTHKTVIYKVFLSVCLLLSLGGCSDYLDQIPEEKLSEVNLFKSKDDVIKVLTQIYSTYASPHDLRSYLGLGDEADYNWSNYAPSYRDLGQYSQSALIYDYWDDYYKAIRTAIYFINRIDECKDEKLTEDERKWWKGEAYFLEAYYYFLLLSEYGPVPIVDRLYDNNDLVKLMEEGISRNTFDECVNYIDGLLVKAIDNLDLFYTSSSTERAGRASKCSAWFLRSRLWLYAASPLYNGMKDVNGKSFSQLMVKDKTGKDLISTTFDNNKWKKAMDITEEAIQVCKSANLGLYKPGITTSITNGYTAYWSVFSYARGGAPSCENVFYKQNNSTGTVRNLCLPLSWSKYSGICPTTELVNSYFMANGLLPDDDPAYKAATGFTTYKISTYTISQYNKYRKRDPRFYANILYPGQYSYAVLGNEVESYTTRWAYNTTSSYTNYIWFQPFYDKQDGYASKTGRDYTTTGFVSIKYVGKTDSKTSLGDYAVNVFRFAELLLNHSEAAFEYYANSGVDPSTKDEVFKYWDEIRARVQVPDVRSAYKKAGVALTVAKLRELVRREREVELDLEGHRYYDNRRWLIAEREGGDKYGMNIMKKENEGFWDEKTVFETRAWGDKMYFMPIPQSEIDKNPKLTQNPLWDAAN